MSSNSFANTRRALKKIPGGVQKALYASMGRALSHSKTVIGKEIRKEYTVKARTARQAISAKRSKKAGSIAAEICVKGRNLLAGEFLLRPKTDTTGSKRKVVRLGIRKTGTRYVDRGFVSKGTLMQRKGKSSYPIEPVFGPSVPGMAANEHVVEAVQSDFKETFEKRMDHEVSRILKGSK